jgi:hypothetical protein
LLSWCHCLSDDAVDSTALVVQDTLTLPAGVALAPAPYDRAVFSERYATKLLLGQLNCATKDSLLRACHIELAEKDWKIEKTNEQLLRIQERENSWWERHRDDLHTAKGMLIAFAAVLLASQL